MRVDRAHLARLGNVRTVSHSTRNNGDDNLTLATIHVYELHAQFGEFEMVV